MVWFPEKFKHLSPWKTGGTTNELISFEDLGPTMIDLVGGQVPDYMNGRALLNQESKEKKDYLVLSTDRVDNGYDLVRSVTDGRYIYSRNFMAFIPEVRYINYLEIADITKHMRKDLKEGKLNEFQSRIFRERPYEVLYDIENDIWEEHNLANNPKYSSLLNTMRKQLDATLLKSKDVLFIPEYDLVKISEKQSPYEYRLQEGYNFNDIYKVASLSGKKGKEFARAQLKYLKSKDRFVRYWASVGLMSQEKSVLDSHFKELQEALEDEYPPVSITISAILYNTFQNNKAAEILKKYSKSDNWTLALHAINHMLYFNNRNAFEPTIKDLLQEKSKLNFHVKSACQDFVRSQTLKYGNQ